MDCNSDSDSQVIVRVLGANLYSPVFSQRFYLAEVRENAPPGTKVIQVALLAHYSQEDVFPFRQATLVMKCQYALLTLCADLQVRATDEDSGLFGQITYSFINDLGKTQFAIDADGVVITLQKLDRENPLNKDMVLTVMALDGGGMYVYV